jgi:predicted regulator of Ras-like GTPase activity (Roadblock/LC7/MglB family)
MTPERWQSMLVEVTAITGVRGAVVVSAEDGLVVHSAAVDEIDTAAVAALATGVARRAARMLAAMTVNSGARLLHLVGTEGALVAAQGPDDMWLVAVTGVEAEMGRLRLLLSDLAPELA